MGDPRKKQLMPSQDELYGLLEEDDPGIGVTAQRARSVPKVNAVMGASQGGDPDIEAGLSAPDQDDDIEAALAAPDEQQGSAVTSPVEENWYDSLIPTRATPAQPSPSMLEFQRQRQPEIEAAGQHFQRLGDDRTYAAQKGLSSLLPGGSIPVPGEGVVGNMVAGGVSAGATRAMDAYGDDPNHDVLDALAEGGDAAWKGAGIGGGLAVAGKAASGAGKWLGSQADQARLKAMNIGEEALKGLSQAGESVSDATGRVVKRAEELIPPNKFFGRSPQEIAGQARGAANESNARIVDSLDQAQAQGVDPSMLSRDRLMRSLDNAADVERNSLAGEEGMAGALNTRADFAQREIEGRGPQFSSPHQAREARMGLDNIGYKGEQGTEPAFAGQAARVGRDELAGQLDEYVGQATPEVAAQYRQGNADYPIAANVRDASADAALTGATGGGVLPRLVGGAAGAGLGYMAGGLPGAGFGAAAGAVAGKSLSNPDMAANIGRGLSNASNGAGGALTDAAAGSGIAGNALQSWLSDKGVSANTTKALPNEVSANAEQLMQSNPQAFGKWQSDFQRAQQNGSLDLLIGRLVQSDPEFRNGPYKQLQTRANASQR